MTRLLKCYGTCNNKYSQREMIIYKNKNHCADCYKAAVKEVKDREDLYNCLKEVFTLSYPTGLMLRQIKQFREDRGYTYKNIRFAVTYLISVKKMKLQTQYGIAMVPHIYDEMIAYYKDLKERREKTNVQAQTIKTITIKPKQYQNNYREQKLINMEELL